MVSDGCISGGIEFKTELGGWLFSACQVIIVCLCFISLIIVGGEGICQYKLLMYEAGVNFLFLLKS